VTERADDDAAFAAVWTVAATVPGWLTDAQARRLWDEASRLDGPACVVEIGSHQGRSTVVLARALSEGRVVAIDPFVDGPLFGGLATRDRFEATIRRLDVVQTVELLPERSQLVRRRWSEPVDLLFIDGKHDYWTCSDDLRWAAALRPGATLLVHDAFSSIGVTLALLVHALPARGLAYLGRDGSLARFARRAPRPVERARLLGELPWWLRNVGIKILLRLRLGAVARLAGHRGTADPY
jgi:hypothetical protein